jgi:hypothetical protein
VDGLLARASQQLWSQFSSLDETFVIRIGSNITGKENAKRYNYFRANISTPTHALSADKLFVNSMPCQD